MIQSTRFSCAIALLTILSCADEQPFDTAGNAKPIEEEVEAAADTVEAAVSSDLVLYPVPDKILNDATLKKGFLNDTFKVEARSPSGKWQEVKAYDVRVDLHTLSHASFVQFDFAGQVEVRVTPKSGTIRSARIRPLVAGVTPNVSGNALSFSLSEPHNLSLEVNGDILQNLHVFANPLETSKPDCHASGVVCFGPGLHQVTDNTVTVKSNTTIYLAGGAVLEGRIRVANASHVTIRGRGIIDMAKWNSDNGQPPAKWATSPIALSRGTDITIEGIVIKQGPGYHISGGEVSGVNVRNVKILGSQLYGDGIDMMSCSDIRVDGCFIRTSDDAIAVYGARYEFKGNSSGWTVTNSTLWADSAHPIFIGVHGDHAQNGNVISGLRFNNIDILEADEAGRQYWGAMSIGGGDKNTVTDVTFDTVRVDHIRDAGGRLIDVQFKTFGSGVYGREISNIRFRNVTYSGDKGSVIAGRSGSMLNGITFENFMFQGRRVCSASQGQVQLGSNVTNVRFLGPNGSVCTR